MYMSECMILVSVATHIYFLFLVEGARGSQSNFLSPLSGQLRTGNFFARTPLIKTVMRLFTAASNYSQLWLCSIDYDSHE